MEKQQKSQKTLVLILALLLLLSLFYIYKMNNEKAELVDLFELQKEDLSEDLDEMALNLDEAITADSFLTSSLEESKLKVTQLRDSVKGLKISNYRVIRKYKKQIKDLKTQANQLFRKVDSLSNANALLSSKNTVLTSSLEQQNIKNITLEQHNASVTKQNNELNNKIIKGSVLKINTIDVLSMRERNNGKYRTTTRARSTNTFRVSFDVVPNPLAKPGARKAYITVQDSNANVINPKGVIAIDGKQLGYSDVVSFDYNNENIVLVSLVKIGKKEVSKGTYTVNIYIDGLHVGKSSVYLK